MDMNFSWRVEPHGLVPVCHTGLGSREGVSLLDSLLMDDGGLGFRESIPWLQAGLRRARAVAAGEVETTQWLRERWGANLSQRQAKLFSLLEEDFAEVIDLDQFAQALAEWILFLQSEPGKGA